MQRYCALNENLELCNQDKFHITKVMRMKVNDLIEVAYDGKVFLCKILELSNNSVVFETLEEITKNNE